MLPLDLALAPNGLPVVERNKTTLLFHRLLEEESSVVSLVAEETDDDGREIDRTTSTMEMDDSTPRLFVVLLAQGGERSPSLSKPRPHLLSHQVQFVFLDTIAVVEHLIQ